MSVTHSTITSSERPTHPGGVLAHGLHAVAAHLITHQLPVYGIEVDTRTDHVTVRLAPTMALAWVQSPGLQVDQHDVRPSGATFGWDVHDVTGRLTDTGVRVRLTWVQQRSAVVVAVPAPDGVVNPDPACHLCGDTGLYTPVRSMLGQPGMSVACPLCDGGDPS